MNTSAQSIDWQNCCPAWWELTDDGGIDVFESLNHLHQHFDMLSWLLSQSSNAVDRRTVLQVADELAHKARELKRLTDTWRDTDQPAA